MHCVNRWPGSSVWLRLGHCDSGWCVGHRCFGNLQTIQGTRAASPDMAPAFAPRCMMHATPAAELGRGTGRWSVRVVPNRSDLGRRTQAAESQKTRLESLALLASGRFACSSGRTCLGGRLRVLCSSKAAANVHTRSFPCCEAQEPELAAPMVPWHFPILRLDLQTLSNIGHIVMYLWRALRGLCRLAHVH